MIEWKLTPLPSGCPLFTATLPSGRWNVRESMDGPGRNRAFIDASIKFTPTMPAGETHSTIMAKVKEIERSGEKWSNDSAELFRYLMYTELGYANSVAEAEILIEMLEKGDDGSKTADDVLLAAGYTVRHEHSNWRGDFRHYDHPSPTMSKLNVVVATDGINATYDRANGWYNIMRLSGDHLNDHIRNDMIKVWWPDTVNNYRRIGAEFIIKIVELRRSRGGLFRVPLLPEDSSC